MGLPIAERLLKSGFEVRAIDVSAVRVEQCRAIGMAASTDLSLAAGSDIVLGLVATDMQWNALLAHPVVTDGRLRGTALLVMSTIGPEAIHGLSELAEARGLRILDCPVTGGVAGAASGNLTMFTSGDAAVVREAEAVLNVLGRVSVVGARVGDGQAFKLVNQMLASIHLAAAGEALAFAERLGLNLNLVQELLPTGAGASWMLADRGPRMVLPTDARPLRTQLSVFVKDSGLVDRAVRATDAHAPLSKAARAAWIEADSRGFGDTDDSHIVEVFKQSRKPEAVEHPGDPHPEVAASTTR